MQIGFEKSYNQFRFIFNSLWTCLQHTIWAEICYIRVPVFVELLQVGSQHRNFHLLTKENIKLFSGEKGGFCFYNYKPLILVCISNSFPSLRHLSQL